LRWQSYQPLLVEPQVQNTSRNAIQVSMASEMAFFIYEVSEFMIYKCKKFTQATLLSNFSSQLLIQQSTLQKFNASIIFPCYL
jgi:hypothetical protein